MNFCKNILNCKKLTFSFLLFSFIIQSTAMAASEAPRIPLFFPAEKNGIQILAPRFEYTVLTDEKIKIGDVLVDTSLVNMELLRSPTTSKYRLKFTWPSAFLQDGTLTLQNNNGVVVWEQLIRKSKVSVQKSADSQNPELRADLSQVTSNDIKDELLENMKYYPFMKFCVTFDKVETRIQLCSKELFLASQKEVLELKSRPSKLKKAEISINGKDVEVQGVIFLNDVSQIVSFQAQTLNGAVLSIETKRKQVDFRDFTLAADKTNLVIEASGAEPVIESTVERLANGNWRTLIPIERPIVYLQGEGGIPIRQEFFIGNAKLPPAEMRITLNSEAPLKTYASQVEITGDLPPGGQISNLDFEDSIHMLSPRKFRWELTDLQSGQTNRYFAQLKHETGHWIVGHDVYRGYSTIISAQVEASLPWNQLVTHLGIETWLEKFLGFSSDLFKEHWGAGFQVNESLSQKSGSSRATETDFYFTYRIKQGLVIKDPSPTLKLYYSQFKFDSVSLWTPGFNLSIMNNLDKNWFNFSFHRWILSTDYFLPTTVAGFEFGGLLKLQASAQHSFSEQTIFEAGLNLQSWKLPSSTQVDNTQLGISAGLKYLF